MATRSVRSTASPGHRVALACAGAGAVSALVPLAGWATGRDGLTGFGYATPSFPFSSVAILFMAAGLVLLLRDGAWRIACVALAVPVAIGLARLLVPPSSGLGIDGWLFAASVRRALSLGAVQPGILHGLVLIGLPIAMVAAARGRRILRLAAALLAGSALAFASLSLLLVPHSNAMDAAGWRVLASSVPAAVETLLLSLGVLAWLSDPPEIGAGSAEWRLFGLLVPLLLVEPVAASLVEFAGVEAGFVQPLWGLLLSTGLNFAAIAALLAWSMRSAARQRVTLQDLTQALDAAPLALVDDTDRIVHWSRGCEKLYGWSASEAVGWRKHELLQARDARPTGGRARLDERELTEVRRDGMQVQVLEQKHPVDHGEGGTLNVLAMTDIGDRLKAESALRASEDRLALATSAHEIGLFEWDVLSGKLTWTPGSEQRLGLEPGTISDYESWAALVLPADLQKIEQTLAKVAEDRADRFSFTYRFEQKNGVARTIEGSARCFYDAEGRLFRTAGINLDITRHEERETALRAREEQWRSILETVPDAMVVFDARGCITSFSAAAERLFGYFASEAVGTNISRLVPEHHGARHGNYRSHNLATGERRVVGHRRLLSARHASGTEFPIELHVGEAWVGGERLFTGFVRDISDRVLAEERLNTLHQELMHVGRLNAVGEMAAALAHELNQPLSAIANFVVGAELLMKAEGAGDRAAEMLRQANEQVQRAGEVIRHLREFVAKRETATRAESVESIVREAAALLSAGQKQTDVRLTMVFDPAADLVLADRIQVQQVLINLLRNAFEALVNVAPDRRAVVIATRRLAAQQIEISVSDRGSGLSEAMLSSLFTPFTSSKGEGGMGIGLSICRRIVEAHGGTLVAENVPEGGARFRFTLPRTSQPHEMC